MKAQNRKLKTLCVLFLSRKKKDLHSDQEKSQFPFRCLGQDCLIDSVTLYYTQKPSFYIQGQSLASENYIFSIYTSFFSLSPKPDSADTLEQLGSKFIIAKVQFISHLTLQCFMCISCCGLNTNVEHFDVTPCTSKKVSK